MDQLKMFEAKYELCKEVTAKSVRDMMAEYFDPKYARLGFEENFDNDLMLVIDYLMLTLLEKEDFFTIGNFLKSCFGSNQEDINNFKESLKNITIFEDIIELLILIKASVEADRLGDERYHMNIHLCVTYFGQLKKLNGLYTTCKELISELNKERTVYLEMNSALFTSGFLNQ